MDYSTILTHLSEPDFQEKFLPQIQFKLSKEQEKSLIKKFSGALDSQNKIHSVNFLSVILAAGSQECFEKLKRQGLLRYSRYTGKQQIISEIAGSALQNLQPQTESLDSVKAFLNSIVQMQALHRLFSELEAAITGFIHKHAYVDSKNRPISVIKTFLAITEYLFAIDYLPPQKNDGSDIFSYSKEQISEAVSYIISIAKGKENLAKLGEALIDSDGVEKGEYTNLLLWASQYKEFCSFEILVESFGYQFVSNGMDLTLIPPNENFERSIRLGYIRTSLQEINFYMNISAMQNGYSMKDLIGKILPKVNSKRTNDGYTRYVLQVPGQLLENIIKFFFTGDLFFKEEWRLVGISLKEQLWSLEKLKNFKIRDELTLLDIFKIRRWFWVFQQLQYAILKKNRLARRGKGFDLIMLRSMIQVLPIEQSNSYLSKILNGTKLATFNKHFVCDIRQEQFVDLQYKPIISNGKHVFALLNLICYSNIHRNLLALENKAGNTAIMSDGRTDPVSDILASGFELHSIPNKCQIKLDDCEIDFAAFAEGVLFIAECKAYLHPTSTYDLRTIWDYIQKANVQLSRIRAKLNSLEVRERISHELNCDIGNPKQILCAIVTSGRMFPFLRESTYPIRNVFEFYNFLKSGNVETEQQTFSLWRINSFAISDLTPYLDNNSEYANANLGSLFSYTNTFKFRGLTIHRPTFSLRDSYDFAKAFRAAGLRAVGKKRGVLYKLNVLAKVLAHSLLGLIGLKK